MNNDLPGNVIGKKVSVKLSIGHDESGSKYYIDTTTKNISFLQTASDLQKLGVKNNKFMLKIYNRDLVGYNPYDPAISKSMINAVILECMANPYYFLREVCRIPEQGGGVGIGSGSPFILHRGNLALTFCFLHDIDVYLLLPRQCFKTYSTLAILLWAYLFGITNAQFNFMNMTQPAADGNLKKFKELKDALPTFLQQKYRFVEDSLTNERKIDKGRDNVRTILNPVTRNWIESKPSARTEESADTIGRGNTAPIQWSDETEFTPFMGTIIAASGPAYVRAAETAERQHAHHCRIFTTTPGNIDSPSVESTQPTRDNSIKFTENMYDWDREHLRQYMAKSKNGICYIEFKYKQIGMDENYFKKMCMVLEENKIKIKREVLLQRIRGAADSPFLEDDLLYINSRAKTASREIVIKDFYILNVYEELHSEYPYIVSVDPATGLGVGSDNTAINIIDPYTLTSIAVLVTPYADAVETSEIIVEIVTKYTPKCMLVIERNSLGSGVISIIARTPIASNMYYDSTKTLETNTDEKLNKKGYLDASPAMRRYWGVTTINKNREIMTNEMLTNYVHNYKNRFIAPELITDLNNLCVKTGGRIEARKGSHDDVVMSYLIGCYVYEYGKRIHQWGIVKGMRPMSKTEDVNKNNFSYEDYYNELPDELKEFFPNPQGESYSFMNRMSNTSAPPTPGVNFSVENGFRIDAAERNEIYNKINEIQAANALVSTKEVLQSDGTKVVVRGNMASSDIVRQAAVGTNSDDLLDIVIT